MLHIKWAVEVCYVQGSQDDTRPDVAEPFPGENPAAAMFSHNKKPADVLLFER